MALTDKNLFAYCDNNPVMRADNGGEFWHIVGGAVIGGLIGGISSIVGQAVSGNGINWAEVGVSAASGALTGAITAACPGMGAVATGIVHGVVLFMVSWVQEHMPQQNLLMDEHLRLEVH